MHTSASTVALVVALLGPAIINAAPVNNNAIAQPAGLSQTPSVDVAPKLPAKAPEVPSPSPVPAALKVPAAKAPKVPREEVDAPEAPEVSSPSPVPAAPKVPAPKTPKVPRHEGHDAPKAPEVPSPSPVPAAPKVPAPKTPKVPRHEDHDASKDHDARKDHEVKTPKVPRHEDHAAPKAPEVPSPSPIPAAPKVSAQKKQDHAHKRAVGKSSPVGVQHKNRPFSVPSPVHGPATPRPVYGRSEEAVVHNTKSNVDTIRKNHPKLTSRDTAEAEVTLDDILELEVEVGELEIQIELCKQGKLDAQYLPQGTLDAAAAALVSLQANLEATLSAFTGTVSDKLIDLEIEIGQLKIEIALCQAGKLDAKYLIGGSLEASINLLAKVEAELKVELAA
ncbi:hypothetical protein RUND412_002573 [Rhizina undulata]